MPRTDRRARVDVEDLLVRVKNGAEPELGAVAREVAALAEQGRLGEDDDEDGLLVPALLARLAGSGDAEVRVLVMAALRRLVGCAGGQSKVRANGCYFIVTPPVARAMCLTICSCGVVSNRSLL
jgi:hypothetical protein